MHHHHKHCKPTAVSPVETVVYPTKHCVKNTHSVNEVNHVHPAHTTVVNHHLQKNKHYFPHTTSFANTYDAVNINMGPVPPAPPLGTVVPAPGAPVPPAGPMNPAFNPYAR
ncbi:spore coat protein D [Salirhabdus euzebyi]|uniref:Spore coat protein D n=1 Tax=Salirhabdus euzebyi TaxID=394506 RepID=A0A841PTU1_9BACI|nr:CotD family spore coat protein [Salirhabdus euzebyi]MBB6452249.1 spore coat protein D [Salirhabdus euzebyi]